MNIKFSILILALAFSVLTSCTVSKTTTSKTFDIYGAGVVQTPVLVDLDVKEVKVTGTATGSSSYTETVKKKAVANAIENSNADVLVEPTFKTTTEGSSTTAEVTGFPATYKNFRTIQKDDIELLEAGVIQKAEVYEPKSDTSKKPNKAGVIAGVVGAVALIILLVVAI